MSVQLDKFLDDFGRALPTEPPARVRRPVAAAGAVAVAAVVAFVILLASPGSSDRLNVIDEARAALDPQGEIVHVVTFTRYGIRNPSGNARSSVKPQRAEQWSATNPPRYRVRFLNAQRGDAGEVDFRSGRQTATRVGFESYSITRGLSERSSAAEAIGPTPLGNDPVAKLRDLLADGRVRDAGLSTVGGRRTRRLTGVEFPGRPTERRYTYEIDRESYEPVRVTIAMPPLLSGGRPGEDVFTATTTFERFETLPPTEANLRLLRITIPSGARIVLRDAGSKAPPKVTRAP